LGDWAVNPGPHRTRANRLPDVNGRFDQFRDEWFVRDDA
jgi:hypothetical protein